MTVGANAAATFVYDDPAQRSMQRKMAPKNSEPFSRERFRFACETKSMIQKS
jgi:hypothetical protein